jgi:hypothetical protein
MPRYRSTRRRVLNSALILCTVTFACSEFGREPVAVGAPDFDVAANLDVASRRIVTARNALHAFREAGEISQQSTADRLRRRFKGALEGVARTQIPAAIYALDR